MGDITGFRLNSIKDSDIIAELSKYGKGYRTERIKELFRKGLEVERQRLTLEAPPPISEIRPHEEPKKTIVWNFPKEPTVKSSEPEEHTKEATLRANLLSNDF